MRGIKLEEADKLDGEDDDHADFIMEVMEARSALEEAQSEEEISEIRQDNKCESLLSCSLRLYSTKLSKYEYKKRSEI